MLSKNEIYLKKAQTLILEFKKKEDTELLKQAYQSLEEVLLQEETDPKNRNKIRNQSLVLWLNLIQLVDQFKDTKFDAHDFPEKLVQPTSTEDGVTHRPGTDPSELKNRESRVEYERIIDENRQKTTNYIYQVKLSRIDKEVTAYANEFIVNSFEPSLKDRNELESEIDKIITSTIRKVNLKSMIP